MTDLPLTGIFSEQREVCVPLVTDDFSAGEAANRNDLQSYM